MVTEDKIKETLKGVKDPEVGLNIVDMGLIYNIAISGSKVDIEMTLTSPACPAGPQILSDMDMSLKELEDIDDVNINVVWSPVWDPSRMSEDGKDELGIF